MNIVITSRELLLEAAKEIAAKDGISKINIRAVAAKCGVSIGSIYNYFPTKADLVVAVIENFWLSAFVDLRPENLIDRGFIQCFEIVYDKLSAYLATFQNSWVEQLALLKAKEKEMGRQRESDYFGRIKNIYVTSLTNDKEISDDLWDCDFTKEAFSEFALENMLSMLKNGQKDGHYFIRILKKILY